MHVVDTVIFACWAGFWLYWLGASLGAKAGTSHWTRFAGIRIAVILLVLILVPARVFKQAETTNPWLQAVGLAALLLGLALAVWARVHLGRNWGMPMSQKVDPELVTTGPYRRIRHPIYSGIILAMIGTALAVTLYGLIAVALLAAYFLFSTFVEERNMTRLFPDAYPEYARSTKRLIPFVL